MYIYLQQQKTAEHFVDDGNIWLGEGGWLGKWLFWLLLAQVPPLLNETLFLNAEINFNCIIAQFNNMWLV
jgi:hypothetical protein